MAHSPKTKAVVAKKRKSFTKFLAVFEEEVSLQAFKCNKDMAKEITAEAKSIIENQSYRWRPLTDQYLRRKIKQGYDRRILIRTKEYVDSISWGVTGGRVWAGIPALKIHQGSGMPIAKLARIHEFGTKTVPARPLWRPLLSKHVRQSAAFGRRYRKAANAAIARKAKL